MNFTKTHSVLSHQFINQDADKFSEALQIPEISITQSQAPDSSIEAHLLSSLVATDLGPSSNSPSESSIRLYVESLDGSVTDDDISDASLKDKINRGTLTEKEDSKPSQCKYCVLRLSKLRKLEKIKTNKLSLVSASTNSLHNSQNPQSASKKERACQTSASLFERAEMTNRELRSLAMILRFRHGKYLRTETFCKCAKYGRERDCRCGEEENYFDWVWDPNVKHRGQATSLQEQGHQVIFHKDYSCGTSAVRGQQPMEKDQYFWEIKMTTPVYGTDMMVGVGTENVDLNKFHNIFCSMLGYDMDSWGISYDGRIQHGGRKQEYCSRFGQGAIIGVHLDMWHGTLAFFKNRQCLGVAFKNLRGRTLYPMACSTAARSGMKVISSRSFPTSLQFLCCQRLRKFVPSHLSVLDALAMPPGLRAFLANNMTWLLHVPHNTLPKPKSGYICEICLPFKSVLEGCTDDEDESSDEDTRIEHIHDVLNLGDSDDDITEDEEKEDSAERKSQTGGLTGYLLTPRRPIQWQNAHPHHSSAGSASTSRPDRVIVMQRTLCSVKKFRLSGVQADEEAEEENSDEELSEPDTSSEVQEESLSDIQMEIEQEGSKQLMKLGKRKRS
ncbi:unnamed protein product [Lymnaea stagnalis]|uniref:SPRY domain-containing SOCS box protein 3 n=1 Tax=Lymnaea stagnalis TaxID=6523 RepID=A0AAV2IGN5_LYMST